MRDLTEKQQRFAEYRLSGYPPLVSARLAGYADTGGGEACEPMLGGVPERPLRRALGAVGLISG